MRNFYYLPIVNKEATGQHIKQLAEENEITLQQLKHELYNYDNLKDPESRELSDTTIYDWFAGKYLPELSKLLRLSSLFRVIVEDIIVYRCEFIEVGDKKSKSTESGTKIHSLCKNLYFPEENLTIEELQKKYASSFEDLIYKNKKYAHTIYEDEFDEEFASSFSDAEDRLFLCPDFNPENLKDNVIKAMNELSYNNKIFETLFNTYRQRINGWKSKYINPKSNLPDNQKKLAPIPVTENLLSLLRMANVKVTEACFIQFNAQKDKKFDFDQFESNYERIRNKTSFEELYNKAIEERREILQLYWEHCKEEYNEYVKDYEKQTIEELVYSLDDSLPETILEQKLNHEVFIELVKKYETKMERYDYSSGVGTYSIENYILERVKTEKVLNDDDYKKLEEYLIYMFHFKEIDDYNDYLNSLPKEERERIIFGDEV